MAITSASTLSAIIAEYKDNADYHVTGSVTKAQNFVTACRYLLLHQPKLISQGGNQLSLNPDLIRKEMLVAQQFVSSNRSSGSAGVTGAPALVKHPDFTNFR